MSWVESVKRAVKGRNVAPLTDAVFVEKVICFDFRAITTEIASIRGISRITFHMELFFALSIGNTFNSRDGTPTTLKQYFVPSYLTEKTWELGDEWRIRRKLSSM